jgi:diadenosine tetraphosphate (Ap4A) HIT family hydrolase
MFVLHPQLEKDSIAIGSFPLSVLLLCNDSNYPWFILVPQRPDVREVYQLSEPDQMQLNKESVLLAGMLADHFKADKMNIAALGNMVPQLHIHHIVRYTTDPAWPNPVWGQVENRPYQEHDLHKRQREIVELLKTGEFIPY